MTDHLIFLALLLLPAAPILFLLNVMTLADVLSVARHAWPATGLSRRRWIAAAIAGLVVAPVGLAVMPLWRLRARPRLEEASPGSLNPFFSAKKKRTSIFDAAATRPARLFRVALIVLAMIGVGLGMPKLLDVTSGDPAHVAITDLSHDIAPKSWIEAHCATSVVRALHLEDAGVEENGHFYQRWTVTPKPGHVDRVLLDTDTGTVVCP